MDKRQSDTNPHRRSGSQGAIGASMRTRSHSEAHAPALADVATPEEASALVGAPTDTMSSAGEPADPRDPRTLDRLRRRTAGGGYEIADTELVLAIRAWDARGARPVAMTLCQLLVDRCMPEFRRRAMGLRQRPALMEDAIEAMTEQLLNEALNPNEVFMTQNFIHYLKCLCIDNFNRTLRQEGLAYRRDEHGRPAGRPQHIPRALIEQIDLPADDQDETAGTSGGVADPHDKVNERIAAIEAQRILQYLPDPLDRQIFALRALYKYQWEEIAKICKKTERTMRLRYEKARVTLQERLMAEMAEADGARGEQYI